MAFKKTLAQRLFNISKITTPLSLNNCRISSSPSTAVKALASQHTDSIAPDPGDDGIFRRFLHRRPAYQSPEPRSLPTGEKLLEKLRGMDILRNRISLDGLIPPPPPVVAPEEGEAKLTVEDARKLLRLAQVETVKAKLRQVERNCISYDEFVKMCSEATTSFDQGVEMAKMLDQSGTVLVLGKVVFLRPEQVMKAIQGLMNVQTPHQTDPRMKETLEEMEKQKAAIDKKAESLVRRELWCGLGYLVIQTAAFMRLTFWELTWDVMEPICFYVTSMYFMAGYAFFLRTSKEPSFEGFFQSRFATKQKRLFKLRNFDIQKYDKLREAAYPNSSPPPDNAVSYTSSFTNSVRT